jgi:hypothetical protein
MPITITLAVVGMATSIGTTAYSAGQQKKLAKQQAFQSSVEAQTQRTEGSQQIKDAYAQQTRLALIGVSGEVAKNYQLLQIGKQQQLELQNQYQQYQYLKIGGIVLGLISVTYLFTKRP